MILLLETQNYKLYNADGVYKLYKNTLSVLDFECELTDVLNFLCDCDRELESEAKKYKKILENS